jgi:hypothetical protein
MPSLKSQVKLDGAIAKWRPNSRLISSDQVRFKHRTIRLTVAVNNTHIECLKVWIHNAYERGGQRSSKYAAYMTVLTLDIITRLAQASYELGYLGPGNK